MDKAFLLPIVAWIALLAVLCFDSRTKLIVKVLLNLFLFAYIYFWWADIWLSLQSIKGGDIHVLWDILQKGSELAVFSLFWISPLMLFTALVSDHSTKTRVLWSLAIFSGVIVGAYLVQQHQI